MADVPLKRWSAGEGGDAARAAALVRALREAPTLTPGALAAARQHADDARAVRLRWSPAARRWATLAVAVPVLAAAAAAGVRAVEARLTRSAPERPLPPPAREAVPRPPPELPAVSPPEALVVPVTEAGDAPAVVRMPRLLSARPEAAAVPLAAVPRVEAPTPDVPAPASPPVAPLVPAEDPLLTQSRLLAAALAQLRQAHQPAAALESLDALDARFPGGALSDEARLARIEALLALGRAADALALLDGAPASIAVKGGELLVLRGELREGAGRHAEALEDFRSASRAPLAAVRERALYGAAGALARLGRDEDARAALEAYLEAFPDGRFAAQARTALGR